MTEIIGASGLGQVDPSTKSRVCGLILIMICAYILKCVDNTYYVGSTNDLDRRLHQHNFGQSKHTKSRLPFELVYTKEFKTLKEARSFEYFIKRQRNKIFYEKLIQNQKAAFV